MPKMKVFLTWSGPRSKEVARALRTWLPKVIQNLEPWMSEGDLDKGIRWNAELSDQLEQSQVGIICLTPENHAEPWVNFEAGALSKLGNSNVCTYLLGLMPQDVPYPLGQFQSTKADKEDTKKLLHTINKVLGTDGLPLEQLNEIFEKWWADLENIISVIPKVSTTKQADKRTPEEVLEELVSVTRETSQVQTTILVAVGEMWKTMQEDRRTPKPPWANQNIFDTFTASTGPIPKGLFGFGASANTLPDILSTGPSQPGTNIVPPKIPKTKDEDPTK